MDRSTPVHRYFVVMRYQRSALLLISGALVLVSCKKDVENEAPRISIVAPVNGSTLVLPDTLLVTVDVSDDQRVEQVTVSLLDANNITATAAVVAVPGTNPATLTLALPVTSEQMESGLYKILATADDGEIDSKDFHTIQVVAIPARLRSLYSICVPDANTVALYRTDSIGQTTLATSWPMDLGGGAVSSKAQLIYVAGGATGPLSALSPDFLTNAWQVANLSNSATPWFTSVDLCADGRLYVGDGSGVLRGYIATSGTGVFNAILPPDFRAQQTLVINDLVLCYERHYVTDEMRLIQFQRSSGATQQDMFLDMEPVQMFERDADHVLIFGNSGGQGRVKDLAFASNSGWEAYAWPSPITAVAQLDGSTWLVALEDGSIERYTYSTAGSLHIADMAVLHDLAFDPVNGVVYGAGDGQVIAIDPQTGTIMATYPMVGTVSKVLPLFNR